MDSAVDRPTASMDISCVVNGDQISRRGIDVRMTAADFLRDVVQLRGTHVGCEHGVCGACTILVDGRSVRSCIMFAVQLRGTSVRTVEGLAHRSGQLHPLQDAFMRHHGLQCGFCTPGMLLASYELLSEGRDLDEGRIRDHLSGNLCRCTGYQGVLDAVQDADRTWSRQ